MPGSQDKDVGEVVADAPQETEPATDKLKENGASCKTHLNGDSTPKKSQSQEALGIDTTTSPTKEDLESGPGLLAQGKRHLYIKDYPSAVTVLGDACAKLSEMYGDKADECADAYFHYGSALLELAREEMGVLGDEVENKDKDSEESDEEEAPEEESEAADEEKKVEPKAEASKAADEGEKSEQKNKEEKSDVETKETEQNDEKTEDGAEKKIEEEEGEEEEDVNNLQLAWEIFELAKIIFERQNNDKKLADTYLKLGEVAMESENYGSAIDDMNKCLAIQQKIFEPDNRSIAETLFQLGIASSLCNQFNEAIKYFTNAGVVLERRIRNLATKTTPDPEQAKNPFYSIEKEIDEIRGLLPEIKDKIADMEDFKNESMKAIKASLEEQSLNKDGAGPSVATNGSTSAASSSSSSSTTSALPASSPSKGPAKDISHLIRKKRKADDEKVDSNETKKANIETK